MLFQVVFIFLLVSINCDKETFLLNNFEGIRLPNNTKPINYDLHIITNIHLNDFDYNGSVIIEIKAINDTNVIIIHADSSLTITKINLMNAENGNEFRNLTYQRDDIRDSDFFIIYSEITPLQLKAGKHYILSLGFNGTLDEEDKGFYRSYSFISSSQTNKIWIASTFFQPFYARLAFPCFDEPQLKARFKISITHGNNFTALSNMPVDSTILKSDEHMVTTRFKETPPMSTYTVAFFIGVVDKISLDVGNITTNIYSPRGSFFRGEFALDVAAKSLNTLENYLELDYPFSKLDHISVNKFPASAMENWGLIIYKVGHLSRRYNDKENDIEVALVIAHEITHQWFGNLVTPKWWNNIWLNEGITTFYSYKIMDMIYPEMKAYECYCFIKERGKWTNFESTSMTAYVENKREIWNSFSSLFYWKGSEIIRMFEHAIGESTFKKGIIKYLQRHQYSSVEENDLFDALQEAATEDNVPEFKIKGTVAKMMSSWTKQLHYPILDVKRDSLMNNITISQRPVKNLMHLNNQLWWIPITMATASSPDFNQTKPNFIFPNEKTITISPSEVGVKFDSENDWLILNKQGVGLYRVLYEERNYYKIIEALSKDTGVIHSYNKAQLIRDAFYFVKNSYLSHLVLFKLYECLENDLDLIAWNELILNVQYHQMNMILSGGKYYFNYFFNKISKNILEHVGIEKRPNDTAFIQVFRERLLTARCFCDSTKCKTLYKYGS